MALPLNLTGIQLPGAFSFINGANQLRFVANYKACWFHLASHDYILRKHESEVRASREQFETLLDAVKPLMDEKPKMTLAEALDRLRENDQGAA